MDKEVSIVLVKENKDYRNIAKEHWGLTNKQMEGMHVHHHPPKSQGGRNVPEHLYVCSESMHHYGWHNARFGMVPWASAAGRVGGKSRAEQFTKEHQQFARSKQPKEVSRKNLLSWLEKRTPEETKKQNQNGSRAMIEKNKRPTKVTKISSGEEYLFESVKEASETLGLNKGHLSEIARGNSTRRTCKGYTAEYLQ